MLGEPCVAGDVPKGGQCRGEDGVAGRTRGHWAGIIPSSGLSCCEEFSVEMAHRQGLTVHLAWDVTGRKWGTVWEVLMQVRRPRG